MAIRDWPAAERPRERLAQHGAAALSDAELLAIFLRVGVRGKSAVDLARDLLASFDGDLARLAAATTKELARLPGIGPAKAAQLAASLELARRALAGSLKVRMPWPRPKRFATGCACRWATCSTRSSSPSGWMPRTG
jgi:DNA repair protein RadC